MISEHIPYLLEAQMQCYNSYITLMEHIFETELMGDKDQLTANDLKQRLITEGSLKHIHNKCLENFIRLKGKTMKMSDSLEKAILRHVERVMMPTLKIDTPSVPPDLLGPMPGKFCQG